MAAYFFDTSALVKRYATEIGTMWVNALIDPATGNRIYVARITEVELLPPSPAKSAADTSPRQMRRLQ